MCRTALVHRSVTERWDHSGCGRFCNRVGVPLALQRPVGQYLLLHDVCRSHTVTHHSRYDSSGRVIISSQRPLPDNTQHSEQTDIHTPAGIRNHNLSRRGSTILHLKPHGLWDWRAGVLDFCKHKRRSLHVCYNICAATRLDGKIILSYCSMLKPASPESHWSWQRRIARNDGGQNVVLLRSVATSACCENKGFRALTLLTVNRTVAKRRLMW